MVLGAGEAHHLICRMFLGGRKKAYLIYIMLQVNACRIFWTSTDQ